MNVEEFHNRLNELYKPPMDRFVQVDVPEIRYMTIEGKGDPEQSELQKSAKWLYAIAHLIKPEVREKMGKNFVEPPLECIFWADDPMDFKENRREQWKWKVMIVLVDWITDDRFSQALQELESKWGEVLESRPALTVLNEGSSVQRLNVGDYSQIAGLCKELYNEHMPGYNLAVNGPYHEIYLNDPSRTEPGKRKIILRQPVCSADE